MRSQRFSTDEEHRVLRFHPRGTPRWRWTANNFPRHDPLIDDLAKFEHVDEDDDYRQRMKLNALAFAATVLLVCAGVWLAVTISEMVKVQDCFLSGRHNCAPIEVGAIKHS